MKKRLLSLFLMLAMLLSTSLIVSAQENEEYLTRSLAVEEIVKALYLSSEDADFSFENYYCLHPGGGGYIHFVPDSDLLKNGYPLICEIYGSVDGCGFSDISMDNDNLSIFITLAKAMGIVGGYDDNTFRPDKTVSYNETVKMLVCAFGLKGLAEASGGYPNGYVKVAEEAGITAGIAFDGKSHVNRKDFNAMLQTSVDASNSNISRLRATFILPATPQECVKAYAEAVMNRDGYTQFALLDDELKESSRSDFESFGWVTGVSSPWVTGFEIVKISDLEFDVTYQYATSTGPSGDLTVKVMLSKWDGVYRIKSVSSDF